MDMDSFRNLHDFVKNGEYQRYQALYDQRSGYWQGIRDGIMESYLYDGKRRHYLRCFFYEWGKRRRGDDNSREYQAGHQMGMQSQWRKAK